MDSYFHYYCKKDTNITLFPPIDFINNDLNLNITLTKDDLFIDDGEKLLFLIIFGHPQPILGFPIFKKYQFIFNQDTNTIGLYSKINGVPSAPVSRSHFGPSESKKEYSFKFIISIMFIIIFILCAIILRNYFRDLKRKKRRMILKENNPNAGVQLMDYEKIDK